MCLGYDAWAQVALGFGATRWLLVWAVLTVTAVPLLAAGTCWAVRRRGPLPGAVLGGVAALALSDGALRQLWLAGRGLLPPDFPLRPVQAAVSVAVALAVAGLLPRTSMTRWWALGLLVPLGLAASLLVDGVLGRLAGAVL
jgi:hypothetical protein